MANYSSRINGNRLYLPLDSMRNICRRQNDHSQADLEQNTPVQQQSYAKNSMPPENSDGWNRIRRPYQELRTRVLVKKVEI